MKRTLPLVVLFICQAKLHGIVINNDNFALDKIFQENFQVQDDVAHLPILVGFDEATSCYCREVPGKLVIIFGRMGCHAIPHTFNVTATKLKLTTTLIVQLRPEDFEGFYHLQGLQIEGNPNLTEILPGTFSSKFVNLKNLSISFNPQLRSLHPYAFDGLKNLSHLFLVKNAFQNLPDITSALTPKFLPLLHKLSLCQNNFITVGSDDFAPMANSAVEELTLVLCRLEYIHPESFTPLKNLNTLRLGENRFNLSTITAVIENIAKERIPLKLLNLYAAGFRTEIPKKLMEAIAKTNVSYLNLANNQFESINSDSFPYMPNIVALDLRKDVTLDVKQNAFDNLPNLKTLLLSGNNLPGIEDGVLVPSLRNLDLQENSGGKFGPSYFFLCESCFSNMTNLLYLNLNFNKIPHLFETSFRGLSELRVLGLKNSSVYYIQNNTFATLKKLVFLNLENNDFIRRNAPSEMSPDVFSGLDNLKVLLLGGCSISRFSISGSPFVHLKSLVHLGLKANTISVLSPNDFAPLKQLQSIDLSFNILKTWEDRIFLHNQMLRILILEYNTLTYISEGMFEDFSNCSVIKLGFNSFSCDCFTYTYYDKWFDNHKNINILDKLDDDADCISPAWFSNYTVGQFLRNVQNNSIVCDIEKKTRLIIMLPLVLLFIFFVSLGGFVYFYRWHIKYWIFLTRLYLSRKGRLHRNNNLVGINNYIYDAFVSYSTEDRNFVLRLASMLENYEPFLKLCIYERDFEIGSILSESILEGVAKSRKTLLIISDNYAKSQWCRWETHLAEHHRLFFENEKGEYADDTLVLLKLGPVSNNHLTPMLRYLLKTRIYLKWETDEKKTENILGEIEAGSSEIKR